MPPLEFQDAIIADAQMRMSVAEQSATALEQELARSGRLRTSVLARAFSGQLVPQDPNDEPASVLLERIRAERAEKPAARQKGPSRVARR